MLLWVHARRRHSEIEATSLAIRYDELDISPEKTDLCRVAPCKIILFLGSSSES